MWVGVAVFGGEDWKGNQLSPLVYTSGAHDSQDGAMGAGMKKAAKIMRMSALVSPQGDTDALLTAAANVEQYGSTHWTYDDTPRHCSVHVTELTDEVTRP